MQDRDARTRKEKHDEGGGQGSAIKKGKDEESMKEAEEEMK